MTKPTPAQKDADRHYEDAAKRRTRETEKTRRDYERLTRRTAPKPSKRR